MINSENVIFPAAYFEKLNPSKMKLETHSKTIFDNLLEDVLDQVFIYLRISDFMNLSIVNKVWKNKTGRTKLYYFTLSKMIRLAPLTMATESPPLSPFVSSRSLGLKQRPSKKSKYFLEHLEILQASSEDKHFSFDRPEKSLIEKVDLIKTYQEKIIKKITKEHWEGICYSNYRITVNDIQKNSIALEITDLIATGMHFHEDIFIVKTKEKILFYHIPTKQKLPSIKISTDIDLNAIQFSATEMKINRLGHTLTFSL
jgi:hypothetical protein